MPPREQRMVHAWSTSLGWTGQATADWRTDFRGMPLQDTSCARVELAGGLQFQLLRPERCGKPVGHAAVRTGRGASFHAVTSDSDVRRRHGTQRQRGHELHICFISAASTCSRRKDAVDVCFGTTNSGSNRSRGSYATAMLRTSLNGI